MKEKVKITAMVFGFFASALLLYGVFTHEHFEWWLIPIGIISGLYFLFVIFVIYTKVRRGEW